MSNIESKNENVPNTMLSNPTIDIKMALAASNATTLSAVVGPFINLNNVSNNAMPNNINALVIKKSIRYSIILPPPI